MKTAPMLNLLREIDQLHLGNKESIGALETIDRLNAENASLRADLEKVNGELVDYKNRYATMAGEVDCRTLDMVRWKERAEQADLALHIANTDKARAAKELGELREYLAIEVGPEMWHLGEVDKAILTERTRCAEIAEDRECDYHCGAIIAAEIMEEPK